MSAGGCGGNVKADRWPDGVPWLTAEHRGALELLVGDQHGINEELLVHGHGFSLADHPIHVERSALGDRRRQAQAGGL